MKTEFLFSLVRRIDDPLIVTRRSRVFSTYFHPEYLAAPQTVHYRLIPVRTPVDVVFLPISFGGYKSNSRPIEEAHPHDTVVWCKLPFFICTLVVRLRFMHVYGIALCVRTRRPPVVTRNAGSENARSISGIHDLVCRTCKTNTGTVSAVSAFEQIVYRGDTRPFPFEEKKKTIFI